MPRARAPAIAPDAYDVPMYWFAILDQAVERGDHDTAAQATRELERLGVRVQYGRPRQQRETASAEGRSDD
jgi:uncharacterized protein YPO0396